MPTDEASCTAAGGTWTPTTTSPTVGPTVEQTVAPPTEASVDFESELTFASFSEFNEADYTGIVATSSGTSASKVEVEVTYKTEITIDVGTTGVTTDQVRDSIAQANNVPKENVVVTGARRLRGNIGRRLASMSATISTTDLSQAQAVQTSSSDVGALTTALAAVTGNTALELPTQTIAPVAKVAVKTKVVVTDASNLGTVQSSLTTNLQTDLTAGIPAATVAPMTTDSFVATTAAPTSSPTTAAPTSSPTTAPSAATAAPAGNNTTAAPVSPGSPESDLASPMTPSMAMLFALVLRIMSIV